MTASSPEVRNCMRRHVDLQANPARFVASVACVLLFILLLPPHSAAQNKEPKRVLILLEEDLSWPVFRLIDENLRATLRRDLPAGVRIFSEHLDRVHFPDPQVQARQQISIQRKYAASNLDLVIAVGDVPLDVFPDVPLLFLSADPRRKLPDSVTPATRAASVWVTLEAQPTLELARRLQPAARRIVVIGDGSPWEETILNRLRRMYPTSAGGTPVTYITEPVVQKICQNVAGLEADSIVIFTTLTRDEKGQPLIPAEVVPKIVAASAAPVYVMSDTFMGSGAVGGYVASFAEVGKTGGELALHILAGEHPQDIVAQNVYLFDSRQLRRWKIPESALPAGSVVLFRQPGLWESYGRYIPGSILVCLIAVLLLSLLWQRTNRRKFEDFLFDRVAFDRMLSELSTVFINLPEQQVDGVIQRNLASIAEFLRLDRIALFDLVRSKPALKATSSWNDGDVAVAPAELQLDKFTALAERLLQGETILIPDVKDLPAQAVAERALFAELGTTSLAVLPLKAGDELFGIISFASTKRQVDWTADLVERLTLLAEIFSNALMRKAAREARYRHAAIVESTDDAIISTNLDGIILSWNGGAQRLFGYSDKEIVGQPITVLVPEPLRDEENEILERLKAGERIEHYETERLTKLGETVAVSLTVSPVKDSTGGTVGVSKIVRDISERKRAEQNLRESEDRFRLVANSAPAMIWMSGTDKLCNFFNQSWLRFRGRSMEQELGDGWAAGVHPEDIERCLRTYFDAFDARVSFEMEYRLRRFDGEYGWILDFGSPRFERDGTLCGYIGSCIDITERKTSEESLHNLTGRLISAQEEERARIARDLHDDFSQRLALLSIGLGQLWKTLPETEMGERAAVLEMLRRTKEMSSDMHSLSHQLHSSKLEHVGLVPALKGLCGEIAQKYKIGVQLVDRDCPANIPKDVALCLFRVAQEALGNVVKHSQATDAQMEISRTASGIRLRISDAGKGFDPSLPNPDAGIGLIGMNERLRLVGGKFEVKSEPNCGTQVLADVPLSASANRDQSLTRAAGR
jgi:PAS domain S-box-containing protein